MLDPSPVAAQKLVFPNDEVAGVTGMRPLASASLLLSAHDDSAGSAADAWSTRIGTRFHVGVPFRLSAAEIPRVLLDSIVMFKVDSKGDIHFVSLYPPLLPFNEPRYDKLAVVGKFVFSRDGNACFPCRSITGEPIPIPGCDECPSTYRTSSSRAYNCSWLFG